MASSRAALGLGVAVVLSAIVFILKSNRIESTNPGASIGGTTTIFVAPFTINENGSDRVSGAQLAEQVRAALNADKSLKTSRSEMQTANEQVTAARRFGAHYLLMGTVDRKQRGAEIGLRLVRVSDASTAWSGTFWKSATDFPSSASDLAAAISEAIRAERDSEARRRQQSSQTQGLR